MNEYIPLQKLFYKTKTSDRESLVSLEAKRRLTMESSFRTGIEINTGELFLAMPRELSILCERLLRVERKVSQLWRGLPGIAQGAYLRGLILDEILCTNEIEGVHSTRRQIEETLESVASSRSNTEHKRFKEFANLYLGITDQNHTYPKTSADIRRIYDAVMAGELKEEEKPDGVLFRKEAVSIVTSTQKEIHRGVMPESEIIRLLEKMISLIDSLSIPPTYAAIIAHFLFEHIHPFYEGNGRSGRYLLALYLSEPLSLATILSLSKVIFENKGKYHGAFTSAEAALNHGEMTFFVIQMLDFIRLAQDSVIENLEIKTELLKQAENSLSYFFEEPYFLSQKEVNVLFQAVQHHLFGAFEEISLDEISRHSEVVAQTARKYTLKLEEKGLLRPVSQKPLRFALTKKAIERLAISVG